MWEFIWGFRPTPRARFRPVPKTLHLSAHTRMKPAIQSCESGKPKTAPFSTSRITMAFNFGWIGREDLSGQSGPKHQISKIQLPISLALSWDFYCDYEV